MDNSRTSIEVKYIFSNITNNVIVNLLEVQQIYNT